MSLATGDWLKVLLPAVLTAAGVVAVLWLVTWTLSRWLRGWAGEKAVAKAIRPSLAAAGIVTVGLLVLRGAGWDGPRLTWIQVGDWLMGHGLRILFIVVGAYVVARLVDFFISQLLGAVEVADDAAAKERNKRIQTVGRLLRGLAAMVIAGIAVLMILHELEVDISPILTGAGVIGVALGLGGQMVMRDLIAGVFLTLENQIRVGDVITVNDKTGMVESLQLRILVMRGLNGTVYTFHNGAINEYANLTKGYAYAVLDLPVAYKEDLERVIAVLKDVGAELARAPGFAEQILDPPEVQGMVALTGTAMSVRMRIRTPPMMQFAVDRELRRRVKERFDREKIALA